MPHLDVLPPPPKSTPGNDAPSRRTGDTVLIPGDYQYRALTQGPAVQRFWHATKLWLVEHYLQPKRSNRLLDVGCGSGVVAGFAADLGLREVVGVDGNQSAVEFATSQFGRTNATFVQGLVDEIDFPDCYFDLSVCFELIEHIYPDQAAQLLRTLFRLTKPGGRLLVTTPNYRSAWPAIEWILDRSSRVPALAEEQHVARYTHGRLEKAYRTAGWLPVSRHTCCTVAPWLSAINWRAAEKLRALEAHLPFGTILVHLVEKPAAARARVPLPSKVLPLFALA